MATRKNNRNKKGKDKSKGKSKPKRKPNSNGEPKHKTMKKDNGNENGNENKTRKNNRLRFQKTKLYKLYLAEIEKLKGGDLDTVKKFMGGDWLDAIGARWIGSLFNPLIEAKWIVETHKWIKENIWENQFLQKFFSLIIGFGGLIGNVIYFFYTTILGIFDDIFKHGFRSGWSRFFLIIISLGVFDWVSANGSLGSIIGNYVSGSINDPVENYVSGSIIGPLSNFNCWSAIGSIICALFNTLGTVISSIWNFIWLATFTSSLSGVILTSAIIYGIYALHVEFKSKSKPPQNIPGPVSVPRPVDLPGQVSIINQFDPVKPIPVVNNFVFDDGSEVVVKKGRKKSNSVPSLQELFKAQLKHDKLQMDQRIRENPHTPQFVLDYENFESDYTDISDRIFLFTKKDAEVFNIGWITVSNKPRIDNAIQWAAIRAFERASMVPLDQIDVHFFPEELINKDKTIKFNNLTDMISNVVLTNYRIFWFKTTYIGARAIEQLEDIIPSKYLNGKSRASITREEMNIARRKYEKVLIEDLKRIEKDKPWIPTGYSSGTVSILSDEIRKALSILDMARERDVGNHKIPFKYYPQEYFAANGDQIKTIPTNVMKDTRERYMYQKENEKLPNWLKDDEFKPQEQPSFFEKLFGKKEKPVEKRIRDTIPGEARIIRDDEPIATAFGFRDESSPHGLIESNVFAQNMRPINESRFNRQAAMDAAETAISNRISKDQARMSPSEISVDDYSVNDGASSRSSRAMDAADEGSVSSDNSFGINWRAPMEMDEVVPPRPPVKKERAVYDSDYSADNEGSVSSGSNSGKSWFMKRPQWTRKKMPAADDAIQTPPIRTRLDIPVLEKSVKQRAAERDAAIKAHLERQKRGGGSKYKNLSVKKLLATLNQISKSTIEDLKEKHKLEFQLALFCGFIKEFENGYQFTPQAAKSLKVILVSSHNSIQKNCMGADCEDGPLKYTNKHTTRKNNEELDLMDLDSIIDTIKAVQFVQTATIHAIVRENNTSEKVGGGKEDVGKILKHLKKEDVEWLQEKNPDQIKIAIKLGILTPDLELTDKATGIAEDSDVINGISVKEQYAKFQSNIPQ